MRCGESAKKIARGGGMQGREELETHSFFSFAKAL